MEKGGRLLGWAQFGLLGLVLAVGVYFARAPSAPEVDQASLRSPQAPVVQVFKPVAATHALTVNLTGEVRAKAPVALVPEALGRLVEVSPSLRTGGTFRAGEVLLAIDPTNAELGLQGARHLEAAALAQVLKHREQAEFDAAQWRRRNPGQDVPDILARRQQIARLEAHAKAAQVNVRQAEERLADTRYSLPFDGIVIAASATAGQAVPGGSPSGLGIVFEQGRLDVTASVGIDDLAYLGDPHGLAASIWTSSGRRFDAVVTAVAPTLEPRSRLGTLLFEFADVADGVALPMPGAFVRIDVAGPAFEDAFRLPEAAHRTDGQAWIVADGKLRSATPRTLAHTDDAWIVAAFDVRDGIVLGAVPGERPGLTVTTVDAP